MVNAYNNWAKPPHEKIEEIDDAVNELRQHGATQAHKPKVTHTKLGHKINSFLASADGFKLNLELQEKHYSRTLEPVLKELLETTSFKKNG